MRKAVALLCLFAISLIPIQAKKKNKHEEKKRATFSGVITYYGKVTRIPDKSKTINKLGDFDSLFKLYLNKNFSRRVEQYTGLEISITEGINQDVYFQYIRAKTHKFLVVATPQEMRDYQLTPNFVRYKKRRIREVSGKKRIKGYKCKKVVCDILTEDNIKIQLVAWYTKKLYIPGYKIPYFDELRGIPLMYDTYNGEHVITYIAQDVDKRLLLDNFFGRPSGVEAVTMNQYLQSIQQISQDE